MNLEKVKQKLTEQLDIAKTWKQISNNKSYLSEWIDTCEEVLKLLDKVDEPSKPVVPQFVADWIEDAKEYYGDEIDSLRIIYWIGDYISDINSHYEWLGNIENQKLLFNAIANGYEIEKEHKFHVRLKGFVRATSYLNYDVNSKDFFVDNTKLYSCTKVNFTKSWLKDNFPEYEAYNNAGLLEFEEVEDD